MKFRRQNKQLLLVLYILLCAGLRANALPYDYTASIQCLENPQKPQYNGGIIQNPELNEGLKGWSAFGSAKIEHRQWGGNKFLVAHSRSNPYDSISQKIYLKKGQHCTLSAWIQVNEGTAPVTAVLKTTSGFKHAGAIVAESGCWSMLKGGLTADASGFAELYFESKNTKVEIWVDSISLQPFTEKEWISHQHQSIEKMRKTNLRIQAVDKHGKPLSNATIIIQQKKIGYPFGCAMNKNILNNNAYQNWFTSRFWVTTFEDEMKWYSTEWSRGHEDYSTPDAMLAFAKKNGIVVRGHNLLWDDPGHQPSWVTSLSPSDLSLAANKRINSIVSRYKGQLCAWDVVNENLHFSFFESKLGKDASAVFFNEAQRLDGTTTLFMNEYNTIEESGDSASTPAKYLQKLREITQFPGNGNLRIGIGLESHFRIPNIPYIRASIDTLAATGLPIWLTEVDVASNPNQAQYLEQILREAHSHPKVQGIVIWSAWRPGGCYRMCLTDNNFKNLPTGDVVDKLLSEWGSHTLEGKTDADGFFDASLFHGSYQVKVNHSMSANFDTTQSIELVERDAFQTTPVLLQVSM